MQLRRLSAPQDLQVPVEVVWASGVGRFLKISLVKWSNREESRRVSFSNPGQKPLKVLLAELREASEEL